MTRQDYKLIAAVLKSVRPNPAEGGEDPVWFNVVVELCKTFKVENPRFNRGKFIAACGVPNALGS